MNDQQSKPVVDDTQHQHDLEIRREGERRGLRLMLIYQTHLRKPYTKEQIEGELAKAGIGKMAKCAGNPDRKVHDWMSTGDPCWCGSDNCEVCLECLEENHD